MASKHPPGVSVLGESASVHAFPGLSLLMVIKHTPPHGNVQVQSNSQGKVRGKKRDTTLPNNSPVIAACHICVKLISKISAGRSYHCGGDRRGKSASGSATHPPGRLEEKMRRTPGTGEPGGPSPRPPPRHAQGSKYQGSEALLPASSAPPTHPASLFMPASHRRFRGAEK